MGLQSVLDLGMQPLANELAVDSTRPDPEFPLHLRICIVCGLGQVGEYVLPERIFSEYPYLSSMSSSWVRHARTYALSMREELALTSDDLVIEIASNDGYLLREFLASSIPALGIEPASNVAEIARERGVPTLDVFFGRKVARQIAAQHGRPRLIAANNVLAHVPDLDDFVDGLTILCGPGTIVTVENPSLLNLMIEGQFDTIYHEHFSYLSAHAVSSLAQAHGLTLVRVQSLPTHGGSYRFWLAAAGKPVMDSSVERALAAEIAAGLLEPDLWVKFRDDSRAAIAGFKTWLEARSERGDKVVAVGASAKGATLFNAAGVTAEDVTAVTDGSPAKQGRFLPGSHVPIVPNERLSELAPTHVLITPWNIAEELSQLVVQYVPRAEIWRVIPRMERLA